MKKQTSAAVPRFNRREFAYAMALLALIVSACLWTLVVHFGRLHESTEAVSTTGVGADVYVSGHQLLLNAPSSLPDHDAALLDTVTAPAVHGAAKEPENEPDESGGAADASASDPFGAQLIDPLAEPSVPAKRPAGEDTSGLALGPAKRRELQQWELQNRYTLSIPALGINTPVYMPSLRFWRQQAWHLLEEQMQVGLTAGSVAYPNSVTAGAIGNLIIAGHSSPPSERAAASGNGQLFARLPDIKAGQTISVLSTGGFVDYEVVETAVVAASETSILQQQTDQSVLKLITCYPVGTTRERFVVTARKTIGT